MESPNDVRASLAVAALGDLRRHEATSPDGESGVAGLLGTARVLSWPLVVEAASGLILDGSHRAVVLARDFGARFAVVQRVAFDSPEVRVGTWCRVLGLSIPLATLGGPRDALLAELERERDRPFACLAAGLIIDRRYPERLWQFADHRIPDRLFADEAGRRAYTDALARATLPVSSRPCEPCQS
jgi:hypothetical protein